MVVFEDFVSHLYLLLSLFAHAYFWQGPIRLELKGIIAALGLALRSLIKGFRELLHVMSAT